MTQHHAILFDLDGTLLDTAADLGAALNRLLEAHRYPTLSPAQIRPSAGQGCKGLLKLGMNIDEQHPQYGALCEELLGYYHQHLFDTTTFFPGMDSVLANLDQAGIPWGIVTNKPEKFTLQLAEKLQLRERTTCIISGDTLPYRKPHPEPVLQACRLLQREPKDCLYVGDAKIDVIASKAAGATALVALYGYIPDGENPAHWEADGYIEQPLDIMRWMT
jgi:phosphoglycolate phosphatase